MAARKWNPAHHPRDSKGRFTRSSTRVMSTADRNRGRKAMQGFTPAKVADTAAAGTWLEQHRAGPAEEGSALAEYLAGGWRETNPILRNSKTPPPGVDEIDAAMTPLAEGVMLRRRVPLAMFAHIPMPELAGMKVRDAAYASTMLDHPGHGDDPEPGVVTMHIAAPAGTAAYINAGDGEVLLARDTEMAVTRVEPNGAGGWDLYCAVIPAKTPRGGKGDTKPAEGDQDTPPADTPDATSKPASDGDSGPAKAAKPAKDSTSGDQPADEPDAAAASKAPDTPAEDGEMPGGATTLSGWLAANGPRTEEDEEQIRAYVLARIGTFADDKSGITARATQVYFPDRKVNVRYELLQDGRKIGKATRSFGEDVITGDPFVEHVKMEIDEALQGAGFAARFNARNEQFYRANGYGHIRMDADADVGGYAWARAGYDWETTMSAEYVARSLRQALAGGGPTDAWPDDVKAAARDLIARVDAAANEGVRRRTEAGMEHLEAMRAAVEDAPTPLEFAMLGWTPGTGGGKDAMWPGKDFMLGRTWPAVKRIDTPPDGDDDQTAADSADGTGGPANGRSVALADSVASGVSDQGRREFAQGSSALTELVTFNDGTPGVRKWVDPGEAGYWDEFMEAERTGVDVQDAEELGAAILAAFGVRAPQTHRAAPSEIYFEFLPGRTAIEAMAELAGDARNAYLDRHAATDAGIRLGLADAVMANSDRNTGNWMVDDSDQIAGIDHGFAFDFGEVEDDLGAPPEFGPGTNGFLANFVAGGFRGGRAITPEWADNPLTPDDVAEARRRMTALRPEFDRLGRGRWHDAAMARLEHIGDHAKGTRNLIAPTPEREPAPDAVSPEQIAALRAAGATDAQIAILTAASTPDAPAAGDAEQLDIAGGATEFVPSSRAAIGLPERAQVGRERAIAQVQQLGLFASDEREMDGQTAMLDALLAMPAADPPPDAPAVVDEPAAPASIVPDDLTSWSDEQLAGLFTQMSAGDTLDDDGLRRIADEWDRREQAMQARVAAVPEDLAGLPDAEVERLYAEITASAGTLDDATAARLGDELDRRTAAAAAEQEATPKRALLARPVGELDDAELEIAATYAADLGDEDALVRVYGEWDRREQEQAEREAAEQAEREAREAAEREAARVRAEEATAAAADAAAAAELAEAEPVVDVLAQLLADIDRTSDVEDLLDQEETAANERLKARVYTGDLAPNDDEAYDEFDRFPNDQAGEDALHSEWVRDWFTSDPERKARARRANTEWQRRVAVRMARQANSADRAQRRRMLTADPAELSNDELAAFLALLATLEGDLAERVRARRLPELRDEAERRQRALDDRAARLAAGPPGPASHANVLERYATLHRWADRRMGVRGAEAAQRLSAAKRMVLGLPEDADDKALRAAERADPRPLPDRAALVLAWYRHLGQFADLGDTPQDWARGWDNDPDVPPTPDPSPPANIAKAAEVWDQIRQTARRDMDAGDDSSARRMLAAMARAYRIPHTPDADLRTLQGQVSAALGGDDRTPNQRAALFVAELRHLAEADGVDPSDTARFGPPDRGRAQDRGRRSTWRQSTPEQEQRIDDLVARGWDYIDAYAEVHNVDPEAMRREQAGAAARGGGRGSSAAAIRQQYDEWVHLQWQAAEAATRGNLLSKQGQAKAIDARTLFSGPATTANRWASEELKRWWAGHPRMTFAEFKAQLLGGARAARERALSGARGGNEFV